jgi:VanZ family protein
MTPQGPTRVGSSRLLGLLPVALVLFAYLILALAPFKWAPPRRLANAVAADADGVRFSGAGLARTREAPRWLARAIELGSLRLDLRFRTYAPEQHGPARIFTISRDLHLRNLTLGQQGRDLVLRLRRPGSTANGTPSYRLPEVLGGTGWHEVELVIAPGSLRVWADGEMVLAAPLPERPLANWDRHYLVALGNELNGLRPWRGEVARAVVQVGDERVDYSSSAILELPERFWVFANRPRWGYEDYIYPHSLADWIGNLGLLIPLGFLVAARDGTRGSWCRALAVCALTSLVVEIAQVFFSRHPSASDLVLNILGGAAGASIARWRFVRA